MFTYGIAETGKRHTIKPMRARVMLARVDRWLNSTQGASVFFTVLTCVLTTLIALAITQERASFVMTLIAILSVFAILATIGGMLISDETSKRNANWWRAYSRDTIAELRATIARADNAHETEKSKIAKQLLDTMRERDELRAQLSEAQLGAHNLAWALVEDNDIRETTAHELNKIKSAQVFADIVLRDYAQDGLYGYDAKLNAKLNSGLVDFTNYGKDID